MGDSKAEGLSALGEREQVAISLKPDVDRTRMHISESSKLEGSCV